MITLFTAVSCDSTTQYNTNPSQEITSDEISPANINPCPPFCDLGVSIDGDNRLYLGEGDNYTADITNGESPYLYLWNYTLLNCTGGDCSDEGVRKYGTTNSSFNFTNNYQNYDDVRIEVWIDDDEGSEGYASKMVELFPYTP